MARRLFQLCVATALILAVGGHWAVLQSVAWVSMAVNYSQTDSLDVALEKTFNGKNPCKLCRVVQAGKQEEKKQELTKLETKLDFLCLQSFAYVHPTLPCTLLPSFSALAFPRSEAPPSPPPRLA